MATAATSLQRIHTKRRVPELPEYVSYVASQNQNRPTWRTGACCKDEAAATNAQLFQFDGEATVDLDTVAQRIVQEYLHVTRTA